MRFLFKPLDADAIKLRGEALRLAKSLRNAKGVSNRLSGEFLLRAVGDGSTVVVTALPMPLSIGSAPNMLEWVGGYYSQGGKDYKHTVFRKFTDGKLRQAIFGGRDEALAGRADYARYVASGRKQVGDVEQLWPLGFIGNHEDGWLRSPPGFTSVEGQCRLGQSGYRGADPLAAHAVPCRTALLTLHTPFYRETHIVDGGTAAPEWAVTLFRLSSKTTMRRLNDLDAGMPLAIKTDIQADPAVRDGPSAGNGLVEFSHDLLGIDRTPVQGQVYAAEFAYHPVGCFEWDAANGVIALCVRERDNGVRIVVARYDLESPDPIVWRANIEAPHMPRLPSRTTYAMENCNGRFGLWATRAGRGVSNGEPQEPDEIILLASHYGVTGLVQNPAYPGDPKAKWPTEYSAIRLWKINPASGSVSHVELYYFVDDRFYNENGATTKYEMAHALGVTIGSGASAEPALICCRRTVVWKNGYEPPFNDNPGYWVHYAANRDSTGVDEVGLVTVRSSGAIIPLDLGSNYPAYYMTDVARPDGRVGYFCCFRHPEMMSVNIYDPPICEFSPGYVAVLVSPNAVFGTFVNTLRLVICEVATGIKVYESGSLALPSIEAYEFAAVACAEHGQVIDGVASGGTLLVTIYKRPSETTANPLSGCFATRDLGVSFNRVLGPDVPAAAIHCLGSPFKPNPIGGGW